MEPVPSKFFITHSLTVSVVSDLNAFDIGLISAGTSEQGPVSVISVIPEGVERTGYCEMPTGAVTHCVLAQMRGTEGGGGRSPPESSTPYRMDGKGGYMAGGHMHGSVELLRKNLMWMMNEMSRIRDVEFGEFRFGTEVLDVPVNHCGCCVAAPVFMEH